MAAVKMIYYMDVMSSWCTYSEPAIAEVRKRFGDDLAYEWRIAAVKDGEPPGYTQEAMAWWYERSGSMTGTKLNAAWIQSPEGTWWPNVAAEAARTLGKVDDAVRLALARAALFDGRPIQQRAIAEEVAARAAGLSTERLRAAMDDPAVTARVRATTAEFRALPCTMVPTFLITNEIGDVNLLSGAYRAEHLGACIEQLRADVHAYEEFEKAHPPPAGVS
jgi:predicted DsbA family dithiol-disulfide isomerase